MFTQKILFVGFPVLLNEIVFLLNLKNNNQVPGKETTEILLETI